MFGDGRSTDDFYKDVFDRRELHSLNATTLKSIQGQLFLMEEKKENNQKYKVHKRIIQQKNMATFVTN